MKLKNIIYSVTLAAIIIAAGAGCRKSQFNINQTQNAPTDSTVTYDVVLPAAIHATGTIIGTQWAVQQRWLGYWARSGTYAPNVIEETYEITTGFGNGIWNACYDANYDLQIVKGKAAQKGGTMYEGIARILMSHNFQILVDVYGNVPYSQALKGGGNPTPAYDKGIDIYKDLFLQLDTAIDLIKNANLSVAANKDIATNDIIFQGNQAKWIRFANTLKLRMLIHCYAVAGIDRAGELAKIAANGYGYLQAGEDVLVQPGYQSDKPNPFYTTFINTVSGSKTANNIYNAANEWGIGYYDWTADPREDRFYKAGDNGLVGVAYGLPPVNDNAAANLASIGPGVGKTFSAAQNIMTAAESFFLQAEARQRGWITTGPTVLDLVNTGITESFRYVGASTSAVPGYLSFNASYPDVDVNGVAQGTGGPVGGLFTILSQKWFALNATNTLEIWTDYRRVPYSEVATKVIANNSAAPTDHFVYGDGGAYDPGPTISVSPQNTSTKIPVRYLYPQSEYNYNPANVAAEGTVDRYTKIFWDLN
ncbi:MAG TPA: SusD/RagB family nutrient-binding outer membrane lipoprotein [Chitinophagaceae bacterium]|nr:SusD/RagB family nutrient-binding outer membrane lipoprotein [Chitinophagaceae bacterium]